MIIFLKGPLEPLNYFIDCISTDCDATDVCIFDLCSKDFFANIQSIDFKINSQTTVITFNNVGVNLIVNDDNYWELKKVKLYNIMVDHPVYYQDALNLHLSCMEILVIDRRHKHFIEHYYPEQSVNFLPHGGQELHSDSIVPWTDREIEVLYIGSCQRAFSEFPALESFPDKGAELYSLTFSMLRQNPALTSEQLLAAYLLERNMVLNSEAEKDILRNLCFYVENIIAREHKFKTVRTLAEHGIHVEVYGDNWEELTDAYPTLVHVHERVSSAQCLELVRSSKFVLNIMPWFKEGSHERIYNIMLNESICLTERSNYLEEKFTNGKNILFFDPNQAEELVSRIRYLEKYPQIANSLLITQKEYVRSSTWKDRLQNILNKDFNEDHFI